MNHDRVAEVYEGTAGNFESQEATRRRVHWMCSRVQGSKVADVGCSQGVVAILLAREGKTVVGLDRELAVLGTARERQAEEEEATQHRLSFLAGEAIALPFDDATFDTVILGEVLEHQIDPAPVLSEARRVLREDGRLVVTTPYGVLPFPDHKQPLYLKSLLPLLLEHFEISEVNLIDRYLGVAAKPAPEGGRGGETGLWSTAIDVAESRLATQDQAVEHLRQAKRRLESSLEAMRERLQDAEKQAAVATEADRADHAPQAEMANEQMASLRQELDRTRERAEAATENLAALRTSKSYRLMCGLWRMNAFIGRPSRRSPRRESKRANEALVPTVGVGERRKILAAPSPSGDAARDRWLARGEKIHPKSVRVAAILDEMSRACFEPECELTTFGPDDWEHVLVAASPHLLLVESAWSGNGGAWQYGVASYQHAHYVGLSKLRALIDWCRARDIPTVFWSKEDPVHFDRFKEAAALFDHIFTTDSPRIPAYEALRGEHVRSIESLPFAAQPRLHNPIALTDKRDSAPVFAGTYYRNRHPDRKASLEMILDAARPHGLIIYDRTHGSSSDKYGFPERFRSHVAGRLPYGEVISAYKRHKLFLNVNSVVESPTMFSRRVFELLACGTAVVSTESVGIERIFEGRVPIVRDRAEADRTIARLIEDDEHRQGIVEGACRLVIGHHTYRERFEQILRTAGFDIGDRPEDRVTALVFDDGTSTPEAVRTTITELTNQRFAPTEVVLATRDLSLAQALDPLRAILDEPPRVVPLNGDSPARAKELARLASSEWVALYVPGLHYGPNHLRDRLSCTRYAEADAIGTAVGAVRHQFVDSLEPRDALVRRSTMAGAGWPLGERDDQGVLKRLSATGVRLFAGSPAETSS